MITDKVGRLVDFNDLAREHYAYRELSDIAEYLKKRF